MPLANLNRVLLYGAKAGTQAAPQLGIELPELQAILGGDPSAAPRLTAEGVPADPHFSERPLLLREFIQGLVALAAAGYAKQPSLPQKVVTLTLTLTVTVTLTLTLTLLLARRTLGYVPCRSTPSGRRWARRRAWRCSCSPLP